MKSDVITKLWRESYEVVPNQLELMKKVGGAATAFNTNIDAIYKIKSDTLSRLIKENLVNEDNLLTIEQKKVRSVSDLLTGFIHCFRNGIAEEWIIGDHNIFTDIKKVLGSADTMQMGGQAGIIANVLSVCEVQNVYVHTASSCESQTALFLDQPNLFGFNKDGKIRKGTDIVNPDDEELIHFILEFDKGDTITVAGQTFVCPRSNRFIATYDPLNFTLHLAKGFDKALDFPELRLNYIILSGYHLLHKTLPDGTDGIKKVQESLQTIKKWKKTHPLALIHLELASTQDVAIRKEIVESIIPVVDSIGFNEQELCDILDVIGHKKFADKCRKNLDSVHLYNAMRVLYETFDIPRMQLHMFGLYITITNHDFPFDPNRVKRGMLLAATIAASKAATGNIEIRENLLHCHDLDIGDHAIKELAKLADFLKEDAPSNNLLESGICSIEDFFVIATPTIIVDNPLTLVGMGDTISSISLIGAR